MPATDASRITAFLAHDCDFCRAGHCHHCADLVGAAMTSGVYPRTDSNRQGRKPILSNEQVAKAAELIAKGYKLRYMSVQLGVCETTLQRALRRLKEQK